jgi:hypothetical protein
VINLLLALAISQGLNTLAPGQVAGGRVLWSAPFATPGCYASGQAAGASSAITAVRASTATYIDAAGNLQTCQNNEFRVDPDGLVAEPARVNEIRQSNTISTANAFTSPWTSANVSVATVAGSGPAGSGTWAAVTATTTGGYVGAASPLGGATSTTWTGSIWVAAASGTTACAMEIGTGTWAPSTCTCSRSDGGACTASKQGGNDYCGVEVAGITTTPVRMIVTGVGASKTTFQMYFLPGAFGTSAGTCLFTGAQIEAGADASSLCVTGAAVCPRAVDQLSATVPSVPSKGWCISGNWKPAGAWPNALSLWTLGNNYNDANTASSWGNSSLYIVDAASGVKDLGDFAVDPVSPWRVVTCNTAGALSLSVNNILVDSTSTGAGTGLLTTPATTLRLGAQTGGGTPGNWRIKNVKVWSAKSTKDASK